MNKRKIIILLLLVIQTIAITAVAAEERPIEDCSLFILEDGFHFVKDIWKDNYTCSEGFRIYQNYELRLYLENGLNNSLNLYLPDFQDDSITRASNLTLAAKEYVSMTFIVRTLGDFVIEAQNITQKIFTISVIEYTYVHFYERPLMITIISFPLAIFAGVVGTTSEKISENKKKKKFSAKLSKIKQKIPVFSNPTKKSTEEILEAYHRLKQIQNVPISNADIQRSLEETILGFKYMATNPALLIKSSSETELPVEQYPIQVILEEELKNEFKESLTRGNVASIKVALLLKQVMSTNKQLLAMIGRQQSEIRLLRAQAANLKYERDILDRGLVEADGSIIQDSIPAAEAKQTNFFQKNKPAIIGIIVFIIIAIAIFITISIINNLPTTGGI
ncbi:MAG: hypothetical protein ACTSYG_07345 [Candidatus Heimdallarchaeota archaeon]